MIQFLLEQTILSGGRVFVSVNALTLKKNHMKKLLLPMLLTLILTSCKLDSEDYSHYFDYVDIENTTLPLTAMVGDTVLIHARAVATNGCWSNLQLAFGKLNDTLYAINAVGEFESTNGICPEILVSADSTFTFRPDSAATYIFVSQSRNRKAVYDTLLVTPVWPSGQQE